MSDYVDYDLPKRRIGIKHGIDLKWKDTDGTEWVTVPDRDGPVVKLRVTTFRGMSFGARHWYGSLNVSPPQCRCVKTNDARHTVGQICGLYGAYDRCKPEAAKGIHLQLKRPLTERELRSERFEAHRHFENPATNCFNTRAAVVREARRAFEKHFARGWKLEEE